MIKLSTYNNQPFIDDYVRNRSKEIKDAYHSRKSQQEKDTFDDFYRGVSNIDEFLRDLLSYNLFDVINKYSGVNEYFETAFFYSLNIDLICKGKGRKEMRETRERYYDKFWNSGSFAKSIKGDKIDITRRQDNFKKFQSQVRKAANDKYGFLAEVFVYDKVTPDDKRQIIEGLGIQVCPYCNRAYISNFEDKLDKKNKRASADLDHFYCKRAFPLFALSLYNFVPSCKVCNQIFKHDINMDILYPYSGAYDSFARFKLRMGSGTVSASKVCGWKKGNELYVSLLNNSERDKAEREISLFRIEELYQCHNDFAEKLLYRKNVLGKRAQREIWEFITKSKVGIWDKVDCEEFSIFFYGVNRYMPEYEKRNTPLGKLIIDILG